METLTTGAWVSLHDGCEISSDVGGRNTVLFIVCGTGQPFELYFEAEPLRQFIERGSKALAEMDALAVQEGAEQAAREQSTSDQPAGTRP
jgi:hypothetical protein